MAKKYTVCDGKLVLTLEPDDGWYVVTSPMDPQLVTQARTIEEAFEMARDALKGLHRIRMKWFKQTRRLPVRATRK
jgi:antitoxin HicB